MALAEGRIFAEQELKEAEARTEAAKAKAEEERRQKEKAQAEEMKMLSVTVQVLHESGMDVEQIARKLQRPVEVIVDILGGKIVSDSSEQGNQAQ